MVPTRSHRRQPGIWQQSGDGMAAQTQNIYSRKRRVITSSILMAIGLVFCGIGYWIGLSGQELEANGIETTASILNKKMVKRRSSSSKAGGNKIRKRSTRYLVRYQFKTGDGRFRDRKSVSRDFFDKVKFGDKVPVRYLEADPSQNEIELGTYNSNSWIAGGIGAALVLLGTAILFLPRNKSISKKFGRAAEKDKGLV